MGINATIKYWKKQLNKSKNYKTNIWPWAGLVIFLLIVNSGMGQRLSQAGTENVKLKSEIQEQAERIDALYQELLTLRNVFFEFKISIEEKIETKTIQQSPQSNPIQQVRSYVLRNEIEAYFQQVFGDKANLARAVCQAESGLNPLAVSKTSDYGICQIHVFNGYRQGYSAQQLLDYKTNIQLAWEISSHGTNWNPWTVYKTGAYLKYI